MGRFRIYVYVLLVSLATAWLISGQFSPAPVDTWTSSGDLLVARSAACSALLSDGAVLVAGGNDGSGVVNTAELFAGGRPRLVRPMLRARANAACVTLPDGRVLVTGGSDGGAALNSSEIYDPAADLWESANPMKSARAGHTATLLPWGAVLLAGGDEAGALEIFKSDGEFEQVGSLAAARRGYAVAVLANVRVLIAGGVSGGTATGSVVVFDAATNRVLDAGSLLTPRSGFAAAALDDGTVLITGGYGADGNVLASAERFDPATGRSTPLAEMSVPRAGHKAYLLPNNGRVLLVGGTNGTELLSSTDSWEPWSRSFRLTGPMRVARTAEVTSLLRRGGLIAAGGRNVIGQISAAESYRFATIEPDKRTYAPGDVPSFTGTGWAPGRQVLVQVTAPAGDSRRVLFSRAAVADGGGQIHLPGFAIDRSQLGEQYLAEALEGQVRAQASFAAAVSTTTTVTSNVTSPVVVGTAVTYTVTVAAPGYAGNVGGPVVLLDNGQGICGGPGKPPLTLSAANPAVASCTVTYDGVALPAGDHDLVAWFTPDNPLLYSASSNLGAFYELTVTKNGTTGTLTTLPAGSADVGASVTLTATFTSAGGGSATPTGTVDFYRGSVAPANKLNPAPVALAGGQASFATTSLPVGVHTLIAVWGGDDNFTAPVPNPTASITIGKTDVTLSAVTSSAGTSYTYGTLTDLSVTVSPNSGVPAYAANIVEFRDGATSLGTASVTGSGVASISGVLLGAGSHTIIAYFLGDTYRNAAVSAPLTIAVTKVTATLGAAGAPFSAVYGGTLSAGSVTVTGGGAATPTGTITATVGGNPIGGGFTLTSGTAAVGGAQLSTLISATPPAQTIIFTYSGDDNYLGGTITAALNMSKAAVNAALVSSGTPSSPGASVTFTVTLTSATTGTPTGTVSFFDGATALTTSATASGGVATYSTSALTAGPHAISAQYGGDANFLPATTNTLSHAVDPAAAAITLGASTTTPPLNSSVVFTVSVTPASGAPSPALGSVNVVDVSTGATLCTMTLVAASGGAGACTVTYDSGTPARSSGAHTVRADFTTGNAANWSSGSSAPLTLNVGKGDVSLSVLTSSAGVNYRYGILTNFSLTITPSAPATPYSGAIVQFRNGATVLGISSVNASGVAAVNGILLAAGTHTITAQFLGDDNWNPATSAALQVTVTKADIDPGSFTIAGGPFRAVYGGTLSTGSVVVAGAGGPSAIPSGTVVLSAGAVQIGVYNLVDGVASIGGTQMPLTVSATPATQTISIAYSGDANYNLAGATAVLEMTKAAAAVALKSNANPSAAGALVTLTGTVTSAVGTPTGTLTFVEGETPLHLLPVQLTSGAGAFSTTALAVGTHTITVQYSGDPNFHIAISAPLAQVVSASSTTTTLSASTLTLSPNGTVTFSVRVTPSAGAVLPVTGTVSVVDIGTNTTLCSVTLAAANNGAGACPVAYDGSTPAKGGGSHMVHANFVSGNAVNWANSTSNTLTITVQSSEAAPVTFANYHVSYDTAAPGAPVYGRPITFSIKVQGPTGYNAPTGQIVFRDAGVQVGPPVMLDVLGVATVVTGTGGVPALTGGTHYALTWSYLGDGDFQPATSIAYPVLTVNGAPTKTVVSPASTATAGGQITLTAQVCATATNAPASPCVTAAAPGLIGTVTFREGSTVLGTSGRVDASGVASIVIPLSAMAGSHSITATYNGAGGSPGTDPNFAASTSVASVISTGKVDTATALAITGLSGQNVLLTATVRPVAGSGTPTGPVQFYNGSTPVGAATLVANGQTCSATLSLAALPAGNISLTASYPGDSTFASSVSKPAAQGGFGSPLVMMNAADYGFGFAPDSLAVIFGNELAETAATAAVSPWPASLSGVTVEIADSLGAKRGAPIYYASPGQVVVMVPSGTAPGWAIATLTNARGVSASVLIQVTRIAPALYSANASGQGVAAANLIRVRPDGTQIVEPVASYDAATGKFVAAPVDLGSGADQLYLILYGTGLRHLSGMASVGVTMNGISVPVMYAGAQPTYFGLDQVNSGPLPASLRGAGTVNLVLTVEGQAANTVTFAVR